ncbi:MAG TPA: 3-oxoacyl-[acyl-carrier-protein] synthase III C-terminal domain-containing protein [Polyangiaceae bacterium]|jgi:3-oxoacyl-[acyl-carrier-protein] synthase-3
MNKAGIRAIAVRYPAQVRTNDYFREKFPDVVAGAEQKSLGKIWQKPSQNARDADDFDSAAEPYMNDPFRGTVRRRILALGERTTDLEAEAVKSAVAAAGLGLEDVDLTICSALTSDSVGVGNGAHLAAKLGLRGAVWNLETACSSSAVALQVAASFVRSGEYRRVMVVASCSYSREVENTDTLAWFVGDGAAAILVTDEDASGEILSTATIHTAETCNAFSYDLENRDGKPRVTMHWHADKASVIRETSEPYLRRCCNEALRKAGKKIEDIDCLLVNTPTAWYAKFCAAALGFDYARTEDTYPLYANCGPVLLPSNMYRAAKRGLLKPGALVLTYTIGSTSSASSSVMRWGDAALGPDPES